MSRLWILGALDAEMRASEELLVECGQRVAYAVTADGKRVTPTNLYQAVGPVPADGDQAFLVECGLPWEAGAHVGLDHHRPGDAGYGLPPRDFLPASSLGQVIRELAKMGALPRNWYPHGQWRSSTGAAAGDMHLTENGWGVYSAVDGGGMQRHLIPRHLVLTAAADHCLWAAYRGECPDVTLMALAEHRVKQRAEERLRLRGVRGPLEREMFRTSEAEVCQDINETAKALGCAADMQLRGPGPARVRDMRREGPVWPELTDAAGPLGLGFIAGPVVEDGRRKVFCWGSPAQVEAFLRYWAPSEGMVDVYGDRVRGFAGGYLP